MLEHIIESLRKTHKAKRVIISEKFRCTKARYLINSRHKITYYFYTDAIFCTEKIDSIIYSYYVEYANLGNISEYTLDKITCDTFEQALHLQAHYRCGVVTTYKDPNTPHVVCGKHYYTEFRGGHHIRLFIGHYGSPGVAGSTNRLAIYDKHGRLHKVGGPAVEWADGSKEWWMDGELHRDDGPAKEYADGHKEWWYYGIRYEMDHLDDGRYI